MIPHHIRKNEQATWALARRVPGLRQTPFKVHHSFSSDSDPLLQKIGRHRKPVFVNAGITLCSFLSYISAGIHYCMLFTGLFKTPVYLFHVNEKRFDHLRDIWYTRIVKRMASAMVQSPLRKSALRLVNFNVSLPSNSGCIIIICHTPWKRLLVQWCLEKEFAFIISSIALTRGKKTIQTGEAGFKELRKIVNHLRANGRIILAADVFNNLKDCPVQFLGEHHNASLFPVRLARLAEVPLVVAIPSLRNGSVTFVPGPRVDLKKTELNSCTIIQNIISFLDNEIKKSPSIWPSYV